ncbi:Pyridoxal phosphate-dependent decarboxylase [Dillenia turbinata]|uniref:Pyridoxal phosphate-dependent decarboxylase n=1 Tax=Dillenia turbinata TaxID=194707 RepID=A0AAN8ZET6_9MAGN
MGSIDLYGESERNETGCNIPFNNALDPEEFRRQGHIVIDFLADYYQNVEKYPVLSQVEPGYLRKIFPESASNNHDSIENILKDVQDYIVPGLTHWQSPNYFAYFPSSGSIAGLLGEMLSTGFNVVGFNWMASPAATELEGMVMDWLGKLLNLPRCFLFAGGGGGVLHGTTCEAILCTLVASRDRMLSKIGRDKMDKLVVYGSDQTHCALLKATKIAGLDLKNFRTIKTSKLSNFGLSIESFRSTIAADLEAGHIPLFLCATVGTTVCTAVDPVGPLCRVAKEFAIWVHVDAAYAGSACICPEFQHFMDGIEGANSFSLNAHKWFFTTLDCCCLWVKEPKALIKALSTNPDYLNNKATDSNQVVDYKDWQICLSRRFRAMKLWLVLRMYGATKLRNFLRSHVKMAMKFEEFVSNDKRFELVVPRNFATVCFRISPLVGNDKMLKYDEEVIGDTEGVNKVNQMLLESINSTGQVYMTHGVIGGEYVLRFCVGATLTEDRHVSNAWKVVQVCADEILGLDS